MIHDWNPNRFPRLVQEQNEIVRVMRCLGVMRLGMLTLQTGQLEAALTSSVQERGVLGFPWFPTWACRDEYYRRERLG
jgi:hypothetical protein